MIISYSNKFLFLKTKKTASTSIEIFLSKYCEGENDIITPLVPEDEIKRYELTGQIAKNFSLDKTKEAEIQNLVKKKDLTKLNEKWAYLNSDNVFFNHMSFSEIIETEPNVDSMYKISIERESIDRVISHIKYRLKNNIWSKSRLVIFLCVLYLAPRKSFSNFSIYSYQGKCILDGMIDFHNITPSLKTVLQDIGLDSEIAEVPQSKVNLNRKKKPEPRLSFIEIKWTKFFAKKEEATLNYFRHRYLNNEEY